MITTKLLVTGGNIFDGKHLHEDKAALFDKGIFIGFTDSMHIDNGLHHYDLCGDILSIGYIDLQVNGGGGVMFNESPTLATLVTMAEAHRRLGTNKLLPTLITDTQAKTVAAIEAVSQAIAANVDGICGIHLEGPHLSVERKGAHDKAFIRPMTAEDLQILLAAKSRLPIVKVTIAPESTSLEQVKQMVTAGILVSLGHTNADYDTCCAYVDAGAHCATHLFNAMSQLGNRHPGLVGCVLDNGNMFANIIADGIHVHPVTLGAAWRAKQGPAKFFLVSDSMAVAGTDLQEFTLGGRSIIRNNGRLVLSDGTLAGADLDLTQAISVLVNDVGIPLNEAIRASTQVPARFCKISDYYFKHNVTRLCGLIQIKKDLSAATHLNHLT